MDAEIREASAIARAYLIEEARHERAMRVFGFDTERGETDPYLAECENDSYYKELGYFGGDW